MVLLTFFVNSCINWSVYLCGWSSSLIIKQGEALFYFLPGDYGETNQVALTEATWKLPLHQLCFFLFLYAQFICPTSTSLQFRGNYKSNSGLPPVQLLGRTHVLWLFSRFVWYFLSTILLLQSPSHWHSPLFTW